MYSYVYINANSEGVVIYSGIKFHEFYEYLESKFENIILLKGEHFGNKRICNFELFQGEEKIGLLAKAMKEARHNFGDFHFVDYSKFDAIPELMDEDVKQLLYLSHMWRPLGFPIFEVLQNRFVYLAHDDDWYCKLYTRNQEDFLNIVTKKIEKYVEHELNNRVMKKDRKNFLNKDRILFLNMAGSTISEISLQIKKRIHEKMIEGLFIDLSGMYINENEIIIKTYVIGKFVDMDEMFNSIYQHKERAVQVNCLCFDGKEWSIS